MVLAITSSLTLSDQLCNRDEARVITWHTLIVHEHLQEFDEGEATGVASAGVDVDIC
jgi:hypothetical protein